MRVHAVAWRKGSVGAILSALIGGALLWFGCAEIPSFVVRGAPDAGGNGDGGSPLTDAAAADGTNEPRKPMFFVTSNTFPGNFGAFDAGNALEFANDRCADLAKGANLTGTWKAVLWANTSATPTNFDRYSDAGWFQVTDTGTPGPQVLTRIASNARSEAGILTERGTPSPDSVWTGGAPDLAASTCAATDPPNTPWTVTTGTSGTFGFPNDSSEKWFRAGVDLCEGKMRAFYCAQISP